ncbi:MAG: metallophosphoesterase family protein [Anaerolineae bacterium]
MRIAVLADIHSNLVALQTITEHIEAWQPDHVIVAGDIVNRGPRPLECLRFVQDKARTAGWQVIKGNHEDYVIGLAQPGTPYNGPFYETHRSTFWTYQQVKEHVSYLAALPDDQNLIGPDGRLITITHASMRHNRDGIHPFTSDSELCQKIERSAALFCVGHTHTPLIRRLNGTLVVNVGAVGLPFDGDSRACYGQMCWQRRCWSAEIIRLVYDRRQAEQDFFDSGFMSDSGGLAPLILDEFRTARSHLFQWTADYQAQVLAGQMSVEDSAREYMRRKRINGVVGSKVASSRVASSRVAGL